ncbi:MAG: acetylxylan esterase [Verrucomicrobia bacterium]|nr:acetylxylan esterase [Verrucomicrobiota bacterium]
MNPPSHTAKRPRAAAIEAHSQLVITALCLGLGVLPNQLAAQNQEFLSLQTHFERVISTRSHAVFDGIEDVAQWEERKRQTRSALARMLWHDRRWPDSPPPSRITARVEHAKYTIENLVLESAPKLYATANLYLPRSARKPFPVILYQCGHAGKDKYARHGAWFAARGIAVLILDNIEMAELEFTHHGVYSHGWFHWYSRGFSPLAVELLNAKRALDYLCSRADLDRSRIGATGRSGGGMTTFFLAAIDDRVAAAAPVSGTLSTEGWVKQRLTSAHCDCQYPVNSYGLLYSEIGALIAPRIQLLCNADADRGFPMDAFNEMVAKMREIYRLHDADAALRTAVARGGHADTETMRLPVYSFFLKEFLGIDVPVTAEGPVDDPSANELVCFRDGLPLDERLSRIDEELIATYAYSPAPASAQDRETRIKELTGQLRHEVFSFFPKTAAPLRPVWNETIDLQGRTIKKVGFRSFEDLTVRGVYSLPASPGTRAKLPGVLVVDHRKGIPVWGNEQPLERIRWGDRAVLVIETLDRGSRALEQNLRSFSDDDLLHHMKRQAMVAGTTLESMQVYEILRSLEFLRSQPEVDRARITIVGRGETGINGLYAALLDGEVDKVVLASPPESHRLGPHYLGILKFTDIPEVIVLMGDKLKLYGEIAPTLRSTIAMAGLEKVVLGVSLADFLR